MIDDNFLNEVTKNKSSTKAAVPIIGDDFLDTLPDMKVTDNQNVQLVGDDFLDSFEAKPPVPVVEEDFLEQIGGSNGITLAKDSYKSFEDKCVVKKDVQMVEEDFLNQIGVASNNAASLLDGDDFLDQVSENHSSANKVEPVVSDDFLNDVSDSKSAVQKFPIMAINNFLDQVSDTNIGVNHLLNFWLENGFPFSDFVVFFQYLYYHVERLGCVDTLSFKTYEHLVDAVVRREHIFQSRHGLVSNIPLMCQYKFLILDDNYPEYILINPELLKLQMYPLIGGLPTAIMYFFNVKRKWLISDLKKEFSDCSKSEFYRQLCNFLNDRPDLVMLQSP
uniref:Uncharacterized protein n=1 Tax=Panagrolaimus davidi TaxID=227884 RepID=A0A914QUN2_9BILA